MEDKRRGRAMLGVYILVIFMGGLVSCHHPIVGFIQAAIAGVVLQRRYGDD